MDTTVLSLGGSLIAPDSVDIGFLKEFHSLILNYVKEGKRVIIVTGGGSTSRKYQDACIKIAPETVKSNLDWIGIAATKLNAHLVRSIFGELAHEEVLNNPKSHVETDKPILIGSGFLPGCSSDKDAVELAATYGAERVINLTNVDYVFDKNPKEFDDAKPFEKMSWSEFKEIFGTEWKPGLHSPFDPIAALEAEKTGVSVVIANGENLDNLKDILSGGDFKGTIIK